MATRQAQKKRLREERLEREREEERARARRRRAGLLAAGLLSVAAIVAVGLVVFAGGEDGGGTGGASPTATIADVHGVGINPADGALYIATHSGLFRSPRGAQSAERVDGPEQDLMGFSVAGANRFFASGHPGPGQDLPPALGLIESRDRGRSWRSLSLQGEADLHILRASGDTAYAFDGRLRASSDGGRNWTERTVPGQVADLAPNPRDPDRLLAATTDGLQISDNGGRTWRPGGLEPVVLLAWGPGDRVFAVDGGGRVYASNDGGRRWRPVGSVEGPPAALAADGDGNAYLARQDGAVDESSDGGRTWRPRSRN